MKQTIFTTAFLIIILTVSTFAQGLYLGAGIGNTFFSSEVDDAINEAKEIDENSTSWKIFAGYHLTDFLKIEGGYRNFGSISANIGSEVFKSQTSGWDAEAVGVFKVAIIDLFAKAGIMFWSNDITYIAQNFDETGSDFLWGLGVGARLGPIGARLEWESVTIGGPDNLSMVSLSATFGF